LREEYSDGVKAIALVTSRRRNPGSPSAGRPFGEDVNQAVEGGSTKPPSTKGTFTMTRRFITTGIRLLIATMAVNSAVATVCVAQSNPPTLKSTPAAPSSSQGEQQTPPAQNAPPPAPTTDPAEEAAYKAFFDAVTQAPDTRIQLGTDFLQKYPTSRYAEAVDSALVHAYYDKQDWKNFNAYAEKALALNPDDVNVLTIVGWFIPHNYNPNDPDAQKNLDKAEHYEKHAIEVIATLAKPVNMTDDQFQQSKASILSEAHSGLGLVYFRRQQPSESALELQQATQGAPNPDATDYYVLGLDLNNLKRFPEAADAFNHCSQISGPLQDRCKQSADTARKLTAQPK
jgi:tetratricopeptide (TPR) repeat protein